MSSKFDEVSAIFDEYGMHAYLGENVTQREHALQTADLARLSGAPDALIIAALLHDVGHILAEDAHGAFHSSVDAHHDDIGADWCEARFGKDVAEPVRWHVQAKRFLVASDPAYVSTLSEASLHTLRLQGGPMTNEELNDFRHRSGFDAAIQLRLWDDLAKVPGREVPSLASYQELIDSYPGTRG